MFHITLIRNRLSVFLFLLEAFEDTLLLKKCSGSGEMAPLVKCLWQNQEALSLAPGHPCQS